MRIIVANAHENQAVEPTVIEERNSIQQLIDDKAIKAIPNAVGFMFVKGFYNNARKKMTAVCLFVNGMNREITEIHGDLRLRFVDRNAVFAKATINFDEPFIGVVCPDDALLVHINLPVKGLHEDEVFLASDISAAWENVRVTYKEAAK